VNRRAFPHSRKRGQSPNTASRYVIGERDSERVTDEDHRNEYDDADTDRRGSAPRFVRMLWQGTPAGPHTTSERGYGRCEEDGALDTAWRVRRGTRNDRSPNKPARQGYEYNAFNCFHGELFLSLLRWA
jgi:hypothetical protein